MSDLWTYGGLFFASFVAATILPAQSEAALAILLASDLYPPWALLTVASVGNVLGSVVNWLLGRGIERLGDRRWFPVGAAGLDRARRVYRRGGRWSLLLAWLPVVGDPLTVVAGAMREPFASFLLLVAIGKIARYLALAAVVLG